VWHRAGRCIVPAQIPDTSKGTPTHPQSRQPSQWQVSNFSKRALILDWILVGLSLIWFLMTIFIARSNGTDGSGHTEWHFSWAWDPPNVDNLGESSDNVIGFSLDRAENHFSYSSVSQRRFIVTVIASLLFICAIQGLQTVGLHCSELIINMSRDEDVWRALDAQGRSRRRSHVFSAPSFMAALRSWKYGTLLIFKSLLHWLLGQCLRPSFDLTTWDSTVDDTMGIGSVYFSIVYSRVFVYFISAATFAFIVTFLAVMKPKGPQPATYGHTQTIADLVDDWALDKSGRFWWGDKGGSEVIRHAGMSSRRQDLGPIWMDDLYAGISQKAATKKRI
jgi:hypothetical protein